MKSKSVCGLPQTRCGQIQACVPMSTQRLSSDYSSCGTLRNGLLTRKTNFEPTRAVGQKGGENVNANFEVGETGARLALKAAGLRGSPGNDFRSFRYVTWNLFKGIVRR